MNAQERAVRYDKVLRWIIDPANLRAASEDVIRKGGAPGLDGMAVEALPAFLKDHGAELVQSIKDGVWRPSPLRKGRHLLLVPTVTDRLVQQAMLRVMKPLFEKLFSDYSFGYRFNVEREAALVQGGRYRKAGYIYVLKPFLYKFVDTVDYDILLKCIKKRIKDEQVLELLHHILHNTVLWDDVFLPLKAGIRHTGNLSALLCNIYLTPYDYVLEKEGRRFTRIWESCNIYCRTRTEAAEQLDRSADYFETKLKLHVDREKSLIEGPETDIPEKKTATVVVYKKIKHP